MKRRLALVTLLVVWGLSGATAAEEAKKASEGALIEAIKNGKLLLDARYRFEWKDQEGFADEAYANTLRTRLGYETGSFHGFKILVEFENIFSIGDDRFNSTTNGLVQYPVIADPNATEVNRAQVTFTGVDDVDITIGRQRLNLANQRFLGAVDFRQNEQTYDAARLTAEVFEAFTVDYAYLSRVHRVFGDNNPLGEFDSDSHVFAAVYDGREFGKVTAYGLLLDFDEAPRL
ncbi:MAG: alginate export family protein [Rhodospirillales bacterium]|nr:alginate export family protein [Rhodospirillales bacterium]